MQLSIYLQLEKKNYIIFFLFVMIYILDNKIAENAPHGKEIGQVTFDDEDEAQNHIISLYDDNKGRFSVNVSGFIVKATDEILDPSTVYDIVIRVMDDGEPQKQVHLHLLINCE